MIVILKKIKFSYAISLAVGIVFGILLDIMKPIVSSFPDDTFMVPVYLVASLVIISIGIALFMKCQLPLMPCDILIREIVIAKHLPLGRIKTIFDISCLIFAVVIELIFISSIRDIGIGTVISAVVTGTLVSAMAKIMSKAFDFQPVLAITKRSLRGSGRTAAEK